VVANPSSVRARLALVTFHERQHDFKAAQEAAQSALSAIPNDPQVLGALAGAQLAGGNIGQAVETYRRLAASQPQSAAAQLRLAEAEAANKDLSAAIVAARKALALQPSDAKGWLLLAKLMIASGHPDDAIAEARKLQKDRPKDGIGFALEGEIRAAQRNWGDAAVAYRKAYAQSPTPLVAARSYSVLINANQPGEAKALADKWNREHPKDVTLRVMSAQASQARNDAPEAIAQYRAALDIEPDNVVVLNNLAWLLSQAQDPQALDIAERAYRLAPFNPNVMDTLGWTLVNTGDVTRGTQLLRMASNLSPGNSDIRLHLGKALAKAGDKAGARAQLEPLTRLKAGSPVQAEAEKALSTF
jgi:putative PEP-CTERM system TPR-repeat lipoprotein